MKNYQSKLPKITRIELSEKNLKLRWVAIGLLLAIAVAAVGLGMYHLLNVEPGWHTVEVKTEKPNCSGDFTLQYDFSEAGGNAAAQLQNLTALYTRAAEAVYDSFTPEGVGGVHQLNAHVNEIVTVEPYLYEALAKIDDSLAPYFFLAPAMVEYNRVFLSENDSEAALYDPSRNAETAAWLKELTMFIGDPAQISLELLGNDQVKLHVGDAYLAFSETYGITVFFDFGWMLNAFAADYLAEALAEAGFTNGYLASYDGFTRNLDTWGVDYGVNFFTRQGSDLYLPAVFHYCAPMSLVFLRDFPQSDRDRWHYYAYENGQITTAFLDPADAKSKCAVSSVLAYSETLGCADQVLKLLPQFVSEEFRGIEAGEGMEAIWCEGTTIRHTDPNVKLELRKDSGFQIA